MAEPAVDHRVMLEQGQRINSGLYRVQDWDGKEVPFRMNEAQERAYEDLWFKTLIVKSRRRGMSMLIGLVQLDNCLFNANYSAGTIAHRQNKAEDIFQRNVLFPYRHLPEGLRRAVGKETDRVRGLRFSNGSTFYVDTNFRSGTLMFLHISEFAKICAETPAKAREINTGAIKAVSPGHIVVIESTTEGRSGLMFEWSDEAYKRGNTVGYRPHQKLWHMQFFPWYETARNRTEPVGIVIRPEVTEYLNRIEHELGITLSAEQRAWYAIERKEMGDDVYREEPSTFEEAFMSIIKGAIFGDEMMDLRRSGGIGKFAFDPSLPVHNVWDIGQNDLNAIWLYQYIGRHYLMVGYLTGRRKSIPFWIEQVRARYKKMGVKHIGRWIAPHDIMVGDIGNDDDGEPKTRWKVAYEHQVEFEVIPAVKAKQDSIDAARSILPMCRFDEESCSQGIEALEQYRYKWDEDRGTYLKAPHHNWASNGADAFQQMAMAGTDPYYEFDVSGHAPAQIPPSSEAWT